MLRDFDILIFGQFCIFRLDVCASDVNLVVCSQKFVLPVCSFITKFGIVRREVVQRIRTTKYKSFLHDHVYM